MINIALDGPSGSGKSTIARFLAKKLNILYLDTGAMYRAVALKTKQLGINPKDEEKITKIINNINIKVKCIDGIQHTYLDDIDVSKEIRENDISMRASDVSSLKCVRAKMVQLQQAIAKNNSCILDGRDIGSTVMPFAKYKFYISAIPEIRASRRFNELVLRGEKVKYEDVLSELIKRDFNDSHREFSPLVKVDDAIEIDTSNLSIEQVIDKVYSYIKE